MKFIERLSEAFIRGMGTDFGRMARRQPTPDERIRRLYGLIASAEKRLETATPAEKPIIRVGLDAIRQELTALGRKKRM